MNYNDTISWMFTQLPMYQRIGKAAYKPNLDNTVALLDALGNPEEKIRAIHIAGTNGKGSVSHIIASVLQEAGYKVGLYTSPHLKDFRERIKINGEVIRKQSVIDFVENNKNIFSNIKSSFFEMTVGMAFDYFRKENVDFAVIETGLGGRLDSTNLCKPVISIITNIGIDHTAFLGDTIQEIATEKAGIIKSNTHVVVGKHDSRIDSVFIEKCTQLDSPLCFADDLMQITQTNLVHNNFKTINVKYKNTEIYHDLRFQLMGNYQIENLRTALTSILCLAENNIVNCSVTDIYSGVENVINNTGLLGRWQKLGTDPIIICDTGHNIDGITAIVKQLGEQRYDKLHFVLGVVNDKDIDAILKVLPKSAIYYFCKPNIPRGLDADLLANIAAKNGLIGTTYNSVQLALNAAKTEAKINDFIFVGGSTFVVAEVV